MKILIISSEDNFVTQVAKGWLKKLEPDFKVFSAGTENPGEPDEIAIMLMKENNIDISNFEVHKIDEYLTENWNCVITLYPDNSQTHPELTGKIDNRYYIKISDFLSIAGLKDDDRILAYRTIIEDLKNLIFDFYLKISNKEILGSDSCGNWCDS